MRIRAGCQGLVEPTKGPGAEGLPQPIRGAGRAAKRIEMRGIAYFRFERSSR